MYACTGCSLQTADARPKQQSPQFVRTTSIPCASSSTRARHGFGTGRRLRRGRSSGAATRLVCAPTSFRPTVCSRRRCSRWVELDEAMAILERAVADNEDPVSVAWLVHMLASTRGESCAAARMECLNSAASHRYVSSYHLAFAHLGLGHIDRALESLREACEARDPSVTNLALEPRFEPFAPIHGIVVSWLGWVCRENADDARQRVLRRIGLVPFETEAGLGPCISNLAGNRAQHHKGGLTPGTRLPAERELARALSVSRATIVNAYRDLESRGLARGYVGRGTFVSAAPDTSGAPFAWRGKIATTALRATDSLMRDLVAGSTDPALMSVAAGMPALECFPEEAFRRSLDRVLRRDGRAVWGSRRHRRASGTPRCHRQAVRRADRKRAASCRCATGSGSSRSLPDRSRRHGDRRSAGLSGCHSHVPRGGCAARRVGCLAPRSGRARRTARSLSTEADLHESHVPQPNRMDDVHQVATRVPGTGGPSPGSDHRRRHLPGAPLRCGPAAVAALAGYTIHRHQFEQLLESAGAGPAIGLADRRGTDSSISSRRSSSAPIRTCRISLQLVDQEFLDDGTFDEHLRRLRSEHRQRRDGGGGGAPYGIAPTACSSGQRPKAACNSSGAGCVRESQRGQRVLKRALADSVAFVPRSGLLR